MTKYEVYISETKHYRVVREAACESEAIEEAFAEKRYDGWELLHDVPTHYDVEAYLEGGE